MTQPESGARGRAGVLAGSRSRSLPRLIGHVLAAFVLVEALLLGLGLLVTRVLARCTGRRWRSNAACRPTGLPCGTT